MSRPATHTGRKRIALRIKASDQLSGSLPVGRVTINTLRPPAELAEGRPHGTRIRYMAGCRCDLCRKANANYENDRQKARRAGDWNGIVDASKARAHLKKLARAKVGKRAIADATDLPHGAIHEIRIGRKVRIRARTERKILAVTADCRADGALVPAAKTWERIGQLLEEGYTASFLAGRLGYAGRGLQFRKDFVTARNEQRVKVLHRQLTE